MPSENITKCLSHFSKYYEFNIQFLRNNLAACMFHSVSVKEILQPYEKIVLALPSRRSNVRNRMDSSFFGLRTIIYIKKKICMKPLALINNKYRNVYSVYIKCYAQSSVSDYMLKTTFNVTPNQDRIAEGKKMTKTKLNFA